MMKNSHQIQFHMDLGHKVEEIKIYPAGVKINF